MTKRAGRGSMGFRRKDNPPSKSAESAEERQTRALAAAASTGQGTPLWQAIANIEGVTAEELSTLLRGGSRLAASALMNDDGKTYNSTMRTIATFGELQIKMMEIAASQAVDDDGELKRSLQENRSLYRGVTPDEELVIDGLIEKVLNGQS